MKVSVAMAVYNGEKFLQEQLISLYKQKRKPDEVVICDDKSSDNSVNIIKEFIDKYELNKTWTLVENKNNKGYNRNFVDCAYMTTGDVIFFCDQDDIWDDEKILRMMEIYENNPDVQALSCTYELIDSKGEKINSYFNKLTVNRFKNGKLKCVKFSEQMRNNSSCGMILSVHRNSFNNIAQIILENNLNFDLPIGAITSANKGYYILYIPLAYRRIHENNTSAPKNTLRQRISNIDYHIKGREKRIYNMKVYKKILKDILSEEDKRNLNKAIISLEKTLENLKKRKLTPLLFDIFSKNPMINRMISVVNFISVLTWRVLCYKKAN